MAVRLKDRIEANIRQSDKVNSSLSIQLNSGTATVYDGSSAKTINVTPAAISAVNKSGDTMTGTLTLGSSTQSTTPGIGIHVHDLRSCTPSQDMFGNKQVNWYFYNVSGYGWRSIMHTKGWTGTYAAWEIAGPANDSLDTNFLLRSYYSTSASDWLAILHSGNYTSYTVTKTGSGASGTWGISVTGTATALTSSAGDSATPIYFSGGKPVAITMRNLTIAKPNGSGTFNDVATWGNVLGMVNISNPTDGTISYVNPNGQTGWHHFINMSYVTETTNMWQTQLVCKAGTTSLWIRSRSGGSISNSTAWVAPWVLILTTGNYSSYALPRTGGTLTGLLTISTNGKYYQIGCQNSGWAHHSTDATSGHWFNKDVAVQGNIYMGSGYNTLVMSTAGGTFNGHIYFAAAQNIYMYYNGTAYAVYANYNNSNVVLDACGGGMYIGYSTTTGLYFGKNGGWGSVNANGIYGAVWNDYADFRQTVNNIKPGEVVIEQGDGSMKKSHRRLQPGANIVTDTYGFAIGETDTCKTPIAVAGRVLAYPYEDRYSYKAGEAVCSAPNGKVSKMTREEMVMYPDCIIGYVSEIPEYEVWGQTDVLVNGRIWIKV